VLLGESRNFLSQIVKPDRGFLVTVFANSVVDVSLLVHGKTAHAVKGPSGISWQGVKSGPEILGAYRASNYGAQTLRKLRPGPKGLPIALRLNETPNL
jgi:hypothetical protein